MNAIQFLINRLENWCRNFSGIHIRYSYDAQTEYHIVEVDPETIRRGSDEYKREELALWMDFMEQYPEYDLLITEPSEANNMANCLFENSQLTAEDVVNWDEDLWNALAWTPTKPTFKKNFRYSGNNEYALAA